MQFGADRIRRLEQDLHDSNYAIVNLMSEDVAAGLLSYYSCQTRHDYYEWRRDIIDRIGKLAEPSPKASFFRERGSCPLCKGGSSGPYDQGFTLPEGLRRHLEGHGNTRICPVTKAAFYLGEYALREAFAAEEAAVQAGTNERKKMETLFKVDPRRPPELIDEFLFSGQPRNEQGFKFTEQRLLALGFNKEVDQRVVSYTLHHDDYIVLADPRLPTSIGFCVFQDRAPKKMTGTDTDRFGLPDSWKHNLAEKFHRELAKSVARLEARRLRLR
jgi:hypothetical protein